MANILCRTKGNANPKGKPRVYFTCHPEDFDRYFDKICEDIFKSHNCAVFYTEDMNELIPEQDKVTDLESNNLFVVPVTFRLLSQPNRAMDSDIPFALEKHIPVLPFMMEPGIDEFYSRPDKFGELQYLNPYSTDLTEISYQEKLKKYLGSVLISDEMAKRVRAAFDAYIFLSYRKKDRRYANELMRLIHSHPECRDIAIWYDEFLTPGESFRENIKKILSSSQLFTLLVTPNLLEEPDGKPNFVMGEEYPAAKKSGIDILPAEMEETDKDALCEKYQGIPRCMDPHDESFKVRLLAVISKIATTANDEPMHNFLIGLAYLEGIDVEMDRQRGLELITSAAEAGLPEAMMKLYNMYTNGTGVPLNYREAAHWGERLVEHYLNTYGEENPDTLTTLNNLAVTYDELGDHQKALELKEKVYAFRCKIKGEEHPDTLVSLSNLAYTYGTLGNHQKALELGEKAYAIQCKLGEEHPFAPIVLSNLASIYSALGYYKKALWLEEKAYALACTTLGEEHLDTLISLSSLAHTYEELGDYQNALKLKEKAYVSLYKTLGEEHPNALVSLNSLAHTYGKLGDHQKALELQKAVYTRLCKTLGEEHPDTLTALNNLAVTYGNLHDLKKMLELIKKVYTLRCKILGEEHPNTLTTLHNLAVTYGELGDPEKELVLIENAYTLQCKILGNEHPDTLKSLSDMAITCYALGDHQKAIELLKTVYVLRNKVLGSGHPDTLGSLDALIAIYSNLKNFSKALELNKHMYAIICKAQGETHPKSISTLRNWAILDYYLGNYKEAFEIMNHVYALCQKELGCDHPDTLMTKQFWYALKKVLNDAE